MPPATDFDVLIYDSTPAGIAAGIAAASAGCRAAIVTEDLHIGGMQTSGLGWTNAGQRETVGGLARAFHDRVRDWYTRKYGQDSPQVTATRDGFLFEPHVAEAIFEQWLAEAGVELYRQQTLTAVDKDGPTLRAITTSAGQTFHAARFIDASYEGDLLAMAGCRYHIGRESAATYGESLAGVRFPLEKQGQGDRALQPYDYRLCLTRNPDNRVPFRKPPEYDPARYAWHRATLLANPPRTLHHALPLNPMPNGKTDSRTGEWVGGSWDFPESTPEQRRKIALAHRHYSAGYIWFLLTENVLPKPLLEELETWGHAADEFTDNDNWPWHIYVREARRLIGPYVMTQPDVTTNRHKPDSVALGSFYLDVHPVQFVPDPDAPAGLRPEGSLEQHRVRPYEIPYRTLLPDPAEAANLLVPICISASHVAYSSIRMEPVYTELGHAAGLAAAMSHQLGCGVAEIPISDLLAQLDEQGARRDARPLTQLWPRPNDP